MSVSTRLAAETPTTGLTAPCPPEQQQGALALLGVLRAGALEQEAEELGPEAVAVVVEEVAGHLCGHLTHLLPDGL